MELLSSKRIEKLVLLSTLKENAQQKFELQNVYFAFDKYNLTGVAQRELDLVMNSVDNNKNLKVIGHTDNVGSDGYNLKLSKRRSKSVKTYLTKNSWKGSIATEGLGEKKPIATNTTELGRSKNRRCEMIILKD